MDIPRGAADEDGRRAVVHDRSGTLIALDLADGTVLWRSGSGLRPLALVGGSVVALRVGTAAVAVLDAADGTERWTSPPLPLPDWARPGLDDSPGFALRTVPAGPGRVLLRWSARTQYGGGAPPDPATLARRSRESDGGALLDLTGPDPRLSPDGPGSGGAGPLEAAAPAPAPAADRPAAAPEVLGAEVLGAEVVEARRIGTRRIELAVPRATGAVVLRAVDVRSDDPSWEVVLDGAAGRRPPRLRP
ncbi:PQQ-binding-like beta-propeller repeat protein [Streptomyces sp. NRRL B-24484]|uniref:outer membrane protein assembly factor BamB family protein n=1 Tax=Streptomyces sp. NRRL B-24484 TaxID=1463833 RepID=UPI0004BF60D2|nr:PQQ-binding-like beta-propeller repeat protein [Streptomyces sp. NRRL B-24484]